MAASSSFVWILNQEKWVSLRKCTLVLCIYDLLYLGILPGLLLKHWGFINDLDLNPINSGHHRTPGGLCCSFFSLLSFSGPVLHLFWVSFPSEVIIIKSESLSSLGAACLSASSRISKRLRWWNRWMEYKENLLFFLWSARQKGDPY